MATLTSTITESISLNGADRGSTNTLSISSVTQVFHRIVTCPADQDTTLVTFDDSTDDVAGTAGALDVEDVKYIYDKRSEKGQEQYGTTLEDSPEEFYAWLNHLQEELMDATLYIQKIKKLNK